jgi:hypothetical protein
MRLPLTARIKYSAAKYLPFLRIPPPPDREAVFKLRPMRNGAIEWKTDDEGQATLTVPHRTDHFGKLVSSIFRLPEARNVQLDEVGTFVWNLCDGNQTVDAIVKQTSKEYKLNRREVEISVTTYLQMLSERNFIAMYQRGKTKK